MPRMKYVIVSETTSSRCPKCEQKVALVSREDMKNVMFYICWTCRKVFQVGVGEVEEAT